MNTPITTTAQGLAHVLAQSHAGDQRRLRGAAKELAKLLRDKKAPFDAVWGVPGREPVRVLFLWPGRLHLVEPKGGEPIREATAADMAIEAPEAAAFMARKAKGKALVRVLYQPPQSHRLEASFWPDGVLRVHAFKGGKRGELLAESLPGQPGVLNPQFRSLSHKELAPRLT